MSAGTPRSKAIDLLHRAQVLQRSVCEHALGLLAETNDRAEDVLIENDIMSEAALLKALAGIYRTNFVSTEKLAKADIPKATVQMIPRRVAETLGVFPVLFDQKSSVLSVVTPDPDNAEMLREVKLVSGAKDVRAFVARPAAVSAAIRKHHGGDQRAFERFERMVSYDFGTQVTADGRMSASRDSVRRFEAEGSFDRASPTPARPRQDPNDDLMHGLRPSQPQARAAAPPDFDMPGPPPVPNKRASVKSISRDDTSISAPPPPLPVVNAKRASIKSHSREDVSLSAPPPPMPSREPPRERERERERERDHRERDREREREREREPVREQPRREPESARQPVRARAPSFDSLPPPQEPSYMGTRPPAASEAPSAERTASALQNDTTLELLTVMVSLLENARQELRGHSSQVARLLRRVAERMNLSKADTYAVVVAGHIHDLGKMGQFHLTALNCSEYEGHKQAAQKAYDTPLRLLEAVRLPPAIKNAVFHMYERYDGQGFPDKLVGKEIPLGARLLSAADTYADLTQNPRNPFRKVLGPAEAMDVLVTHKGTIFDPAILDLFKALVLGEDMKAKLLANRHRALIIDPDPEESTVLELRMVEQGFDVKIARTADAARKLVSTDGVEFDLVVCEVELPDGDGLAFLSEARKGWGREVAWVVHTQKQGRTEAQKAFDLGAMDFVAKPVQADVLVAKIKAMLEQRSQSGKGGAAKGVSGSLREMGLPDIVQVLFHGRKTGKLNVKSAGNAGEIHFLEGAIANAVLGSLSGADAFYAMVRFQEGEFALDPSFVPPKRLVAESAEALLLEGMRRMDEGI